ncbi:MAG: calcium-binding protein, partial [Salinarimonas sp.]
MSGSPCDPNKDNSAVNGWIGFGATVFGSLMAGVQSFSLSKVVGASSGIAKGMINVLGLLKSISIGAVGGEAGQDNAANGVAASIIGGMITSAIVFGVVAAGFTVAPIVMAVGISAVSAVATVLVENFLERHNINFYDPLQAISDMGGGLRDDFNFVRDLISELTSRDNGFARELEGINDPAAIQNDFELLRNWVEKLPEDLRQQALDKIDEVEADENFDPQRFQDLAEELLNGGPDDPDCDERRTPPWRFPDLFENPPVSPLALDLTGQGLEIIDLDDSKAYFDLDNNGFASHTAWLGGGSGFLALDVNGNGRIDDQSELFGAVSFDGPDDHGFAKLALYDENGDGVIDAQDSVFGDLLIWRDFNGDGLTDEGELFTLDELGIVSISLDAQFVDSWEGANWISHTATFTMADGTVREIHDIWFDHSQMLTRYAWGQDFDFHPDIDFLPDLAGYGTLKDLRFAISLDDDLRLALRDLVLDAPDLTALEIRDRFETFLHDWAGVSDVDPASRGSHVDARKLAVMESLFGRQYLNWVGGEDIGWNAGRELMQQYDQMLSSYLVAFMVQQPFAYLMIGDDLDAAFDNPWIDFSELRYDVLRDRVTAPNNEVGQAVIDEFTAKLVQNLFPTDALAYAPSAGAVVQYGSAFGLGLSLWLRVEEQGEDLFTATLADALDVAGHGVNWDRLFDAINSGARVHTVTDESFTAPGDNRSDLILSNDTNTTLAGGSGNDTYVYARGNGHDTIVEQNQQGSDDQLIFIGINSDEVTLEREGMDLRIRIPETEPFAGDEGSVLLKHQLEARWQYGVETLHFADGVSWTQADLRELLIEQDRQNGETEIVGFRSADVIRSTEGDNILRGMQGNDTYIYARGNGHDTIIEENQQGSN